MSTLEYVAPAPAGPSNGTTNGNGGSPSPSGSEPETGFTELSLLGRPTNRQIFGHLLLAAILAFVGAQAAFFGSKLIDDRFEALSEIEYRGSSWTETQDVLVSSRTVIGPIANDLDIEIKRFEERLSAGLIPGTQLLRITYQDEDPELALAVVQELTDEYLNFAAELPPEESRETLAASLQTLQDELELTQAELLNTPGDDLPGLTVEQQQLQSEVASLRARIGVLELRLLDDGLAELDTITSGIPLVRTDPFIFEEPVFPRRKMITAIGFVAGGMLGLLVLVIRWNRISWATTKP